MAHPPSPGFREVLLTVISEHQTKARSGGPPLTQTQVLEEAGKRLAVGYDGDRAEALLTQWSELFRTGLLAWGKNLSSPDPPFFHLSERGRQALSVLARDPSNPAGYLRHLAQIGQLNPIALSYLSEGLDCYVSGHFKAAAIMVGAASESVILELRDLTIEHWIKAGAAISSDLRAAKIRTITNALGKHFTSESHRFDLRLRDMFEANWSALAHQIRSARNEAGHPSAIDPVTPDSVHAALLVFPELVRLVHQLSEWVKAHAKTV